VQSAILFNALEPQSDCSDLWSAIHSRCAHVGRRSFRAILDEKSSCARALVASRETRSEPPTATGSGTRRQLRRA
jgi:hypothetical protein